MQHRVQESNSLHEALTVTWLAIKASLINQNQYCQCRKLPGGEGHQVILDITVCQRQGLQAPEGQL